MMRAKVLGVHALIKATQASYDLGVRNTINGMKEAGQFLLEKAQEIVPIDTRKLHDSGRNTTHKRGRMTEQVVSFGTHYGLYVHEDLEARHAPGKSAKYLEKPARKYKRQMSQIIARRARGG